MKQVFRFNKQGHYVEPVLIEDEDEIPFDCTDKELPQPNWKPIFQNGDWVETITDEELLDPLKKQKDDELNEACKQAILAGFEHVINGQTYWFSYDMEAQGNFRDGRDILKDGIKTEVPWTVRIGGVDGEYARIPINLAVMNELTLIIMDHKLEKISKYRDELMPLVDAAERPEDLLAVNWE